MTARRLAMGIPTSPLWEVYFCFFPRPHQWRWSKQKPEILNKLYQHRPQIAKTNFCVRLSPSTPTIAHYNGTLHWHHVHSPKVGRHLPRHSTLQWHPAMAPRPLPQSWPSPSPNHSALQWHPAMAPCPLPQSWPSPSPNQRTLQWHPAMAPRPLPQSWPSPSPNHSTLQWHPAMAPSNGTTSTPQSWPSPSPNHSTLQWHPAMAPRPPPKLAVTFPQP